MRRSCPVRRFSRCAGDRERAAPRRGGQGWNFLKETEESSQSLFFFAKKKRLWTQKKKAAASLPRGAEYAGACRTEIRGASTAASGGNISVEPRVSTPQRRLGPEESRPMWVYFAPRFVWLHFVGAL